MTNHSNTIGNSISANRSISLTKDELLNVADKLAIFNNSIAYQTIARLNEACYYTLRTTSDNATREIFERADLVMNILRGEEDHRLIQFFDLPRVQDRPVREAADQRFSNAYAFRI